MLPRNRARRMNSSWWGQRLRQKQGHCIRVRDGMCPSSASQLKCHKLTATAPAFIRRGHISGGGGLLSNCVQL